ncbi:Hypothetical protein BJL86_0642 [Dietzia timorensis]|uniref:Uncharacterized protein n=1 Tax=Dietzia timorensis TaxID=499555 RepID=A0A173LIK0_9ACTN|nr:Hypothetical protein BJL86_0642 [Dietzia timorensis]
MPVSQCAARVPLSPGFSSYSQEVIPSRTRTLRLRTSATMTAAVLCCGVGTPLASAQSVLPPAAAITAGTVPTAACGDALSPADLSRIAELSAPTAPDEYSLPFLEERARAAAEITEIFLSRNDRRAIFGIGLDLVESQAVLPLYRSSSAAGPGASGTIGNLPWATHLSTDLLEGYLAAVHAHVTGGAVPEHWQHYFELASDCAVPGGYAAMAGYNAHLTVDLARAVASSGTTPAEYGQYLEIVGAIADQGDAIVAGTQAEFDADLAPLWRLYFLGDAADAVTAQATGSTGIAPGDGHRLLLRAGDQGYSTVSFAHGLALADPATAEPAHASVRNTWLLADGALEALTAGKLL